MQDNGMGWLLLIAAVVFLIYKFSNRSWKPDLTACGSAGASDDEALKRAGMTSAGGRPLARSLVSNMVIWLKEYTHVLLVGGTGAGKGVSVVLPWLLSGLKNSCIVLDVKLDLLRVAGEYMRKCGMRVRVLGPFTGGTDTLNPLDAIENGPCLLDQCGELAEALVVRTGQETDTYWVDSSTELIKAVTAVVCLHSPPEERNLNTVCDIISNPALLDQCAEMLKKDGGIYARMGHRIAAAEGKEKSGILGTANRSLAFLSSEMVARSVAKSSFDPAEELTHPGTALFLQIPQDQLQVQKPLARLWFTTLTRAVIRKGGKGSEVLGVFDEAATIAGLSALKECLERGRSAGIRLLLAYQSDSQVKAAFEKEPTLVYDNCSTQIYLLPPSGLETAERVSNMLGEYTQVVETRNDGTNTSAADGLRSHEQGRTYGSNQGRNFQVQARKLLDPSEVLRADRSWMVCFTPAVRYPIIAKRLLYYSDPLFAGRAASSRPNRPKKGRPWWVLLLVAALIAAILLAGR